MAKHTDGTLFKNEPVLVAHFVTWLLANVGLILVERYHLINGAEWTVVTATALPIVSGLVIGVIAWLIRRVVTPAWRQIDAAANKVGIDLPDAVPGLTPSVNLPFSVSPVAPVIAPIAADPTAQAESIFPLGVQEGS